MIKEFSITELPLRARLTYFAHAFKAVYKQHHQQLLPLFRKLIPQDGIVFDVGGHAGQYSKLFAKVATNGHVYSFEPGSYACSILRRALEHNCKSNTTVIPEGLGDAAGRIDLNIPVKKNGVVKYGLSNLGETGDQIDVQTEKVKINTIDIFVRHQALSRLDLIKADIEGWEQRMVIGGEKSIRKYMPVIMIEMVEHHLKRAGDSLDGFWSLLESWGYKPYLCATGEGARLERIEQARSGDIFWLAE